MIEMLIENKEWLFSGAGMALIAAIGSRVFKSHPAPTETKIIVATQANQDAKSDTEIDSEVSRIAMRFVKTLDLMNEGREYSKYTIAQLAQVMKLHKVSELEGVFRGKEEPTFEFVDHFANTFGVNRDWLLEGKNSPFSNNDQTMSEPHWYLDEIKQTKPLRVFFVREDSSKARAFLLLKIDDFKYKILHRTWHISDEVGAGGRRQLVSFYELIKSLRDKQRYSSRCGGLTLSCDDFSCLLSGEKYPGTFVGIGYREDPWWDDFTDIHHRYPIAENYESWHGRSFIKAQNIVREKLAEE
ncbi:MULTISPECIES: helix-turn-helix domain-containing protein [Vibrio]|uniref:XRE family transcriptional regulator n=1 Tax=Vibrio paracholerae TaxID=650003 RepID=A0AAX1QLT7_9VIBR|nr:MULTISPECIES: helix-turn-helix transcriptional regulator [Vibrio]EGQ8592792.1 hypothetical protein [Vibrio cholerae]EGR4078868.1 XRE family transcriptional regulator [Vibrio cholerae]MBY3674290.1 helix-turn-helix transcriptional regulator [Vibrio cholerae]MCU4229293.1 helix-turn-helix transcriptional regulator [Vibrio cholerae]MEB5554013.1 hypothetical protein [Vibrio cholerae]